MSHSAGPIYEFGTFRYDAGQRLLFREGELAPLAPKAVDTLHVLIERRGRIVEKGELLRLVWPDTNVEEVGLARNISLLRKALEAEGGENTVIETIPRRGYRFVAKVREVEASSSAATTGVATGVEATPAARERSLWKRPAIAAVLVAFVGGIVYWQFYRPSRFLAVTPGAPSLAVVPFDCMGPEPDCGTTPQAISDLLVTNLVKLGGLSVVSPSTVRRHQRAKNSMSLMGRLLGLDVLVEGTVRKAATQVRITSRLVDVHTGRLIWADDSEFPAGEAERMLDQAARKIALDIAAHLAIRQSFPAEGAESR